MSGVKLTAVRSTRGRRTTGQHHGDLRGALVRAALEMVSGGDVAAISLREIARRAGVSSAAPYHHFPDKEALLAAVAVEGFQALDAELARAAAAGRTPRTRLARMAAEYVRFALAHRAHYRLMVSPSLAGEGGSSALREAAMASFLLLAGAVGAAAGGSVSEEEVRRRSALAWALAHGAVQLAMHGALAPLGLGDDERVASHVGEEVARMATGGG